MNELIDRRKFIKTSAAAGLGMSLAGRVAPAYSRSSPNEMIRVAVMGVNSRGHEVAQAFARQANAEVIYIADVDSRAVEKTAAAVAGLQDSRPKGVTDFRNALDDADVDALVIAAPDHWHTPAAILGLKAGKHVYVEKPCGYNPEEGEMLVQARDKYDRLVQMGNQQRSGGSTIQAIQLIRDGLIGRPYLARAWYANTRESIGHGKVAPVPDWLDYELWQGPAPRTPYRDNVVHYNWHWFHRWGTGEICNNGTHEVDIARWALGVEYPIRVTSNGGRYHFKDDWEYYDTQIATFDFEEDVTITWEGRSCNGMPIHDRGRGTAVHGTEGTIIMDRNGFVAYDMDNQVIREVSASEAEATMDVTGGGDMTDHHVANFLDAIRGQGDLNSPIEEGHKSVLLCHLGNMAQATGETLHCDRRNGHIVGNDKAMEYWSREYEPGWEPVV